MKIVQIVPSFLPFVWGLQVFADELQRELQHQWHESYIVTFQTQQPHTGWREGNIIVLPSVDILYNFPVPAVWKKEFWTVFQSVRALNADCHITHTRFFTSALIPLFVRTKRWIHIEHGTGFVEYGSGLVRVIARVYDELFGRLVLRSADEIIGISQAVVPFVQKLAGRTAQVFYRGFHVPETVAAPHTQTLGFIGRIVRSKGVFELLEAFENVSVSYPELKLLIAGTGSDWEACKQIVMQKQLRNVTFLDGSITPANNYTDFYNRIDIFINPSYTEGLPTTVIEALLTQKAVIATDVGGTHEISDQADLRLIPPKDTQALIHALHDILKDETYQSLQGLSYPSLTQRFSWKTLTHHITQDQSLANTSIKA